MNSSEIRDSFIAYFKKQGHTYVHSSPSVAVGDPTLMFTNAGMNQFKDIFLGVETRSYTRAVNSQKCIRVSGKHNDLEEVGRDGTHHTFFEMLGNWSFGDYYKQEAITWAWDLLMNVWHLDKNRLYATIFEEDDETGGLWRELTDIDPAHIIKLGARDNFWEMGDTGPCGPCSEIHFDRGEQYACGAGCTGPDCECGRFVEFWNLVFIQYNRKGDGSLEPLENKHVDTGMGLERITALMNGLNETYETDLFQKIFNRISELTGQALNAGNRTSFRVIADHIRMCAFAICDGAVPSNEGRGYVVRRVLRRAVRFANLLKEGAPVLSELAATVIDLMGGFFPELKANPDYIIEVLRAEETQFQRTLKQGNELFEKITAGMSTGQTISGTDVFTLYDTYGFPTDLVNLMAGEKGLQVDMAGFDKAMEEQKARSRAFTRPTGLLDQDLITSLEKTVQDHELVEEPALEAEVLAAGVTAALPENNEYIITDTSNFYAEGGGQKGDAGTIKGSGFEFHAADTQKEQGIIIHLGRFTRGSMPEKGAAVSLEVDREIRDARRRNHTATHLLHHVLREEFGTRVRQQGSMVDADRFTFDFTFSRKITDQEIERIEDRVNALIDDSLAVELYEMGLQEARDAGIIALFDEKYGETVRVVDVGNSLSRELCGGTHVDNTGMIRHFKILVEESIAAGNRRIQGCTGTYVRALLAAKADLLDQAVQVLKDHNIGTAVPELDDADLLANIRVVQKLINALMLAADSQEDMLITKLETITGRNESLRRDLGKSEAPVFEDPESAVKRLMAENKAWDREQRQQAREQAGDLVGTALEQAGEVKGVKTVGLFLDDMDPKSLNDIISRLQDGNKAGICVAASGTKGKATVLCSVGEAAAAAGFDAVAIIKTIGKTAGGGGGGKPDFARGGGGDPEKTKAALADLANLLNE